MSLTEIFREAWNEFKSEYKKKCRPEKGNAEDLGEYWSEVDIQCSLGKKLAEKYEKYPNFDGIEVHVETGLDPNCFPKIKGLEEACKALKKKPKVDIAIYDPKDPRYFKIIAEIKWYWYPTDPPRVRTFPRWMKTRIEGDLEKLSKLASNKVCQKAFMCIIDEQVCNNEEAKKKLEDFLEENRGKNLEPLYFPLTIKEIKKLHPNLFS